MAIANAKEVNCGGLVYIRMKDEVILVFFVGIVRNHSNSCCKSELCHNICLRGLLLKRGVRSRFVVCFLIFNFNKLIDAWLSCLLCGMWKSVKVMGGWLRGGLVRVQLVFMMWVQREPHFVQPCWSEVSLICQSLCLVQDCGLRAEIGLQGLSSRGVLSNLS